MREDPLDLEMTDDFWEDRVAWKVKIHATNLTLGTSYDDDLIMNYVN